MPVEGSFAVKVQEDIKRRPGFYEDQVKKASLVVVENVKRHTPVGKQIHPRTGHVVGESGQLRESVKPIDTRHLGSGLYQGGAKSDLYYAGYVEYGVRAHIIEPKTRMYLRFWAGEPPHEIFARRVHHPGFQGKHMFARGLADAERELQTQADEELQEFLKEVYGE